MSTYLAVGSICWDEVPVDGRLERRLGGSVRFAARVAQAAGWRAVVVTSGTAELAAAARAALPGIEVIVQPSAHDTVMAFDERTELGPQRVPTVADPIDLGHLAELASTAEVVHLAPIMGEVTARLVGQLGRAGFVGLTPQGLLRVRGEGGRLALVDGVDPWWADAVAVVVASDEEHLRLGPVLDGLDVAVAVTRGEKGCWGWSGETRVDLPGIEVEASPTGTIGAGDVFAATLLLALAGGDDFPRAMDRANRTAAAHVAGELLG